jgi:electron transfer flavoprotein alpha subunit
MSGAAGAPGIWVVAETNADGSLAKSSAELATVARSLAEAGGGAAAGIVVASDPAAAAKDLASYLPRVVAVAEPLAKDHAWSQPAAARIASVLKDEAPAVVLTGAGPDGRDDAGPLLALLDAQSSSTPPRWRADDGPSVEMACSAEALDLDLRP